MTYKPDGYTSVAPYLVVDDAEAALSFVERVFGGERLRRIDRPDGTIAHAAVRIDDTVVMIGSIDPVMGESDK